MAIQDVLEVAPEIVLELGKIGKWVQAIGLAVIIWIIIQIIDFYFLRKRMKAIHNFKEDIMRIEMKIDKLTLKIKNSKK